ncbi:MAG: hypothetical protein CK604_00495 [Curvibacter sp. PD_MW3]|nr:MAG: hypothetical protein CK604_00495 [Curvibacter sp. PD_MW3]
MISLLILWPLYIIGVQYERGGWWVVLMPITLVALVLDVWLNFTELALLTWDWPRNEDELTFSNRLKRLVHDGGWRGSFARFVARGMLDPFAPGGRHV